MNLRAAALALVACASPALADRLTLQGEIIQGGLIRGATEPGASVALDERAVRVAPDGAFVLGFGRDAKQATLRVRFPDGTTDERKLAVAQRSYQIQRIDGLPQRQVTPPDEDLAQIRDERAAVAAARSTDSAKAAWRQRFIWPANGPISGVYGSQRIINGKPLRPHFGVDVAAAPGTPVRAAAAGTVTLAHGDLYFSGKTVIIDHGLGVSTLYIHMQEIKVATGDRVTQGQVIGTIGTTGRSTGPHLHWGLNLGQDYLDPATIVGPMPGTAPKAKR